jgi:hypothetical protein
VIVTAPDLAIWAVTQRLRWVGRCGHVCVVLGVLREAYRTASGREEATVVLWLIRRIANGLTRPGRWNVLREVPDLAWWRVIPSSGRLYRTHRPTQAPLLRADGVMVDGPGRVVSDSG